MTVTTRVRHDRHAAAVRWHTFVVGASAAVLTCLRLGPARYLVAPSILLVSGISILVVPPLIARVSIAFAIGLALVAFPSSGFRRSGPDWAASSCDHAKTAALALAPQDWGHSIVTCAGVR